MANDSVTTDTDAGDSRDSPGHRERLILGNIVRGVQDVPLVYGENQWRRSEALQLKRHILTPTESASRMAIEISRVTLNRAGDSGHAATIVVEEIVEKLFEALGLVPFPIREVPITKYVPLGRWEVTKVKKGGQHFAQSSSRPALSSIHTASVDRCCAGQLALHTASTVHSYWTTSLGPSGLEHASESESEVTEAPQIRRLRTLKMRASGFAFMRDGGLPQQWAWFNWSKVFWVRMSVHATIRLHRAAVPFFFALLFAT
ncbi:hypothetical protein BC826DRAFT_973395 [Russula brevipes]|nr:hypothetical protein BC826DRAFT_973395 [Russula brevipes]